MSRDADRAEPALSNAKHSSYLPPHVWDDDTHRLPIHQAFDRWFLCHEQENGRQAERYRRELCRLTTDAEARRLVTTPGQWQDGSSDWVTGFAREVEAAAALRGVETVATVPIEIVVAALLVNLIQRAQPDVADIERASLCEQDGAR
jgi:hypothetical protein